MIFLMFNKKRKKDNLVETNSCKQFELIYKTNKH